MKLIKKLLKFILAVVLILVVFLGMVNITKLHPKDIEPLILTKGQYNTDLNRKDSYSMLTWNIGYGALGKDQDFFMDGGKGSGAKSFKEVEDNIEAIFTTILEIQPDFINLQEVDISGNRSKNIDQKAIFEALNYHSSFAINYQNIFVPVPIYSPMGGVQSGIMSLSRIQPENATRYTFDGKESFIVQMFELDRAFSVMRYPVEDKELLIINAHFSAFDKGGKIREKQLTQMKLFLENEYEKGNFVILGADFNHELPNTSSKDFKWTVPLPDWVQIFPKDFDLKGYDWAVDPKVPTVRSNEQAYVKDENFVAIIDGYLVSDNVKIEAVNGIDYNFQNTDHNPVYLKFNLRK